MVCIMFRGADDCLSVLGQYKWKWDTRVEGLLPMEMACTAIQTAADQVTVPSTNSLQDLNCKAESRCHI